MSETKSNFLDNAVAVVVDKLMPPLTRFANLRPLKVIRDGMIAVTPMIMVSSIFLILYMLGTPISSEEGAKALLGFLTPYTDKFMIVHGYCLAFMAVYASVSMGIAFARVYETSIVSTALLSLGSFFAIVTNNSGTAGFDATGLFACFVSTFIAGFAIKFCDDHHFEIKLPDSVPPTVTESFAAITPWLISITACWTIRVILNFDLPNFFANTLGPIFSLGDSPAGYGLYEFLLMTFWSFGIHGDNVLSPIATPLTTIWGAENTAAAAAGVALTQLPHVWAYTYAFVNQWISSIYPCVIYSILSRKPQNKAFGKTMAIPMFFICEPVVFGAPIVMNPIFFIPMILSATVSGVLTHFVMGLGFINRFFINVGWTVPWPLAIILSNGGDFKVFLLPLISITVGMLIWYPFYKAYEKRQDEEAGTLLK